jgi:hypothetical protein
MALFVALAVLSLALAAGAGASKPFVTTKVPLNQTLRSLLRGRFAQTVTCRDDCKIIARLFIRAQLARSLGFKRVKEGQPYAIALRQKRLAANRPTVLRIPLGRDAKKRLAKWRRSVQLTGETYASSTSSKARGQANWIATLRR